MPLLISGKDYLSTTGSGTFADPYVIQSNISTSSPLSVTSASTLSAGENHIGSVGGTTTVITVTPTVSTSPAYSTGDDVGGKLTLANAVRVSGGTCVLTSIQVVDKSNTKPTGTILFFNADPTNGTFTDNAALVTNVDDIKVAAMVGISNGDYVVIDGKAFANLLFNPKAIKAASGTSLFAAFVTTSTQTLTSSCIQFMFGFLQD